MALSNDVNIDPTCFSRIEVIKKYFYKYSLFVIFILFYFIINIYILLNLKIKISLKNILPNIHFSYTVK